MDTALQNTRQNWERFHQIVLRDDQLLSQLQQAADLQSFAALAVELGQREGCRFTTEHVRAAVQEARRAWLERWLEQ